MGRPKKKPWDVRNVCISMKLREITASRWNEALKHYKKITGRKYVDDFVSYLLNLYWKSKDFKRTV